MNKILKSLCALVLLFSISTHAQGPGDESDQGDLENLDTPATPIDANLLWLGMAGITAAFYIVTQKRKAQQ